MNKDYFLHVFNLPCLEEWKFYFWLLREIQGYILFKEKNRIFLFAKNFKKETIYALSQFILKIKKQLEYTKEKKPLISCKIMSWEDVIIYVQQVMCYMNYVNFDIYTDLDFMYTGTSAKRNILKFRNISNTDDKKIIHRLLKDKNKIKKKELIEFAKTIDTDIYIHLHNCVNCNVKQEFLNLALSLDLFNSSWYHYRNNFVKGVIIEINNILDNIDFLKVDILIIFKLIRSTGHEAIDAVLKYLNIGLLNNENPSCVLLSTVTKGFLHIFCDGFLPENKNLGIQICLEILHYWFPEHKQIFLDFINNNKGMKMERFVNLLDDELITFTYNKFLLLKKNLCL